MSDYQNHIQYVQEKIYYNKSQISKVIQAKQFMDKNYQKDISLDQIALDTLVSKYHLLRLFKKYYGLTIHQYLISRRLIEAKKILAQGISVSSVCYKVGFSSLSTFSKLFKSKNGISPTRYQKKAILDK